MADNKQLSAGTADGAVIATDEITGVDYQRVKLTDGTADSTTPINVDNGVAANALRVTVASDSTGQVKLAAGTAEIGKLAAGVAEIGKVKNSGTFVVQENGAALTALQLLDDTVKTLGTDTYTEASSKGTLIGGVRNDVLATLADTDNEIAPLQFNKDGALWMDFPDTVVDIGNSTTTPLTANTDFTGAGVDISAYAGITINLFADQDSDANGMRFEFSSDNSNWDINTSGGFDYIANTGRTFQLDKMARFFRVVFQNAGTNQTAVRIQTLLHHHTVSLTTIHRADDDIAIDRSCTVTKSILMAQKAGAGDFTPINSTAGGNLKVSIEEDGADLLTNASHDAAFGTAGTADEQVRSVQGIASGTDLNITLDGEAVVLGAGTAGIGKLTANSGVDIGDVDVTSIAAGTNVIGKIAIDGQATSGGIKSGFKSLDLDETEEEVKATAGQLHWIHCVNLHTAVIYLKVYDDTAAGVIVGTDVPDWTFAVPTQGDSKGAGFNLAFPGGQEMTVGITVACTLLAADNDATSPGSNVCIFNCGFA